MRQLVVICAFLLAPWVSASPPGTPFDCSDWVLLDPSLSCVVAVPNCTSQSPSYGDSPQCVVSNDDRALTNDGTQLELTNLWSSPLLCGTVGLTRWELREHRGDSTRLLAYLDEKCNDPVKVWVDRVTAYARNLVWGATIRFDPLRGALRFSFLFQEICETGCTGQTPYQRITLFEISGFTTLFDVVQSYQPSASAIGLRVPATPDALGGVDHFDSYWGAVTQPLDLANAHPLQCAYPSTPPNPGDYLTITAPVPAPTPGNANYVLTSVTYQGQTRAGRKASAGRLTGRDASNLPVCIEPTISPSRQQ